MDNYEALKVKNQEGCRAREIPSSTLGGGIKWGAFWHPIIFIPPMFSHVKFKINLN